ncbi:acyl-CoA dehydrogenase family protein [Piscinibacter koreensis]|uniref:Acyl-CoA dehydrogenase family protein n=1 Tax=Piscinibacter koreensis TaxID=2742824 RepID=A0A7Y6NQN3_9BURK|nr:acyl-CoA dehydrogenase family protein [Schlegelella koreensis]NUZ07553.1 acyl-CoA dehydrogenase family protein [Schlegelella koreensis]
MKTSPAAERPPAEGLVRALRQALRGAPAVAREAGFPRAWWRHLGEQGLLGLSFDLDGRGPRADWPTIARLAGGMARETGSLGLTLGWMLNEMLGRCVISGAGIESERVRALLRRMAAGQAIVGLAVSEPDAGAHPKRLRCSARREQDAQGERWLLDGSKSHVSNGPAADVFVVLAVTADDGPRKAFDAFLVEAGTPGLALQPSAGAGSGPISAPAAAVLAPLQHAGLQLDACAVPAACRLGPGGTAFDRIARPVRVVEDALLTSAVVGAMHAELDALARWLRPTQPAPALLRRLGALRLELDALQAVADQAARRLEAEGPGTGLAQFNAGSRRLLERWQAEFESLAATLDDLGDAIASLSRDIRCVLGIARSVGETRQLEAGQRMLLTEESDEVPA